ncbi:MAG: TIGR03790 family protein [Verrucomicrobia bacterium]|nr:TIGR03790 family protein [Verrucomicrobiota bacterium]
MVTRFIHPEPGINTFHSTCVLWVGAILIGSQPLTSAEDPVTRGKQVAILYNKSQAESLELALDYARKRLVPENRIIGLDLPVEEEISRQQYDSLLEEPLEKILLERGLLAPKVAEDYDYNRTMAHTFRLAGTSTIRYLVLCRGVPLKIRGDRSIEAIEDGQKFLPWMRKNEASVDSELAALPMRVLTGLRTGLIENVNFGAKDPSTIHPLRGVLMVTRLDGPTPLIASRLVDKAMEAEIRGLWGRVYIDSRGLKSGVYVLGDQWMREAAATSEASGLEVILDSQPELFPSGYPMNDVLFYCGWYAASPTGAFKDGYVEFSPGAIAYHLHSFSAATVRSQTANWVGPLLSSGVTATLGCVYEPYLEVTPNISVFWDRLLRGFSLGEAAYASLNALSWQTVIVGDPLYQPFALPLQDRLDSLRMNPTSDLGWALMRDVQKALAGQEYSAQDLVKKIQSHPDYSSAIQVSSALNERLARLIPSALETQTVLHFYEDGLLLSQSDAEKLRMASAYANVHRVFGNPGSAIKAYHFILGTFATLENKAQILEWLSDLTRQHGTSADKAYLLKITRPPE